MHPDVIDATWAMFTTGLSKFSYVSEKLMLKIDTLINGGCSCIVFSNNNSACREMCLWCQPSSSTGRSEVVQYRWHSPGMTGSLSAEEASEMWAVVIVIGFCSVAAAAGGWEGQRVESESHRLNQSHRLHFRSSDTHLAYIEKNVFKF